MAALVSNRTDLTLPEEHAASASSKITSAVTAVEIGDREIQTGEEIINAKSHGQTSSEEDSDLLISSPYTEVRHRLPLSSLDIQSSLLARALTALDPATPSYATAEYTNALDWSLVISKLRTLSQQEGHAWTRQSFYVVAFYSRLKTGIDRDLLHQLDKESHAEAAESGGLLKYWFGSPDSEKRNLATCVWRSEQDAKLGGTGPWHKRARLEARNLYEKIEFKRLDFTVEDGVKGWTIE